jgi:murein DD-endopeptidase MepM/ murein hydrolase activator NlpD
MRSSARAAVRASSALLIGAVLACGAGSPVHGSAFAAGSAVGAARGLRPGATGAPAHAASTAETGGRAHAAHESGGSRSQEGGPRWSWPADPPHAVTRPFEAPATAYGPGHRGIDIAMGPGAEVRAPADGVVSFAGVVVDRPVVSVQHADGLVSSVEPVVPRVSAGDAVVAGQVIGTLAEEPRHEPDGGLHLGARLHGEYVDPALLLVALRHAVLLPLGP